MKATGTFFLVVGPSGAGKDSLIDGARASLDDDYVFARRVITRPGGSAGEDHEGVTEAEFARRQRRGEFLVTWDAHDLRYGLPMSLMRELERGRNVVANGSRGVVADLAARLPRFVVILVTAPQEVLAQRISARGRESGDQVARRVARAGVSMPPEVACITVSNDSTLEAGMARFVEALQSGTSASATRQPASRANLMAKLRGEPLDEAAYVAVLQDAIAGRYTEAELTDFLIAATRTLTDAEVVALARARTAFTPRIDWDEPLVVDKHSMGGVPGSRITLVVVPIVAAYGLAMPKTSSRAITSAAGTADAMETIARVDLTHEDVRRCVAQARACIAWNGRLNHSVIDDVMNAITRPLRLDSRRWSVASILSKKFTAGATHVIVDLPFGPQAKLATRADAEALGALFEHVGKGLGLHVRALVTDGSHPIGRGIGPALEVRDVRLVLDNDPAAPADLREKALRFAGEIIAFDPRVGCAEQGMRIAAALLHEGKAKAAFDRIAAAQGIRSRPVAPGTHTRIVAATTRGQVTAIEGLQISGVARAAGAPRAAGAGIDLLCTVGAQVAPGQPLYRIHADSAAALEAAAALVRVGGECHQAVRIDPD
ncbi:phosphonate metabolism protein/1,5-bisphosphokinase (PRPP-forming) PhnN [Cupriavidus oxalaticus]|jgi:thymidine phosphorylase|uniref:Multifunctional fusion protein n=1 Tax=Cupriavidus oxalaticus TaxID=96344 RepID=A0A976GBR1_9BURK|nr:phosphonate metabolism protein/1,5-bisphosphokinase (PRPP-forming) PhnN [Cupriavidus oxalaticus]QRQ84141.1 phosphonate metabolism protein/1,5-bisphosphokinase (PRPP-forming) PhnN [Cupriavidus oxalaticus]QRQ91770.1 phosphonate metabolism protein/1,5-bisphosphokinase (PRPP-forming) PhnN [Cupriavidus oxalaticus]WQD86357.1 phosphonate metabolism protein/1,5-bisphosphokinase (PRPP-forming) PhnN [Cupriavidus oxalaticus]SPC17800.1 putative Bifunctional ribose 1,5-bisphosphokinase-thymidine phosphor